MAAFGGMASVMDVIGGGSVTHAGPFGANGVATAAAMVMKYWNHPQIGQGYHSNNHPDN